MSYRNENITETIEKVVGSRLVVTCDACGKEASYERKSDQIMTNTDFSYLRVGDLQYDICRKCSEEIAMEYVSQLAPAR